MVIASRGLGGRGRFKPPGGNSHTVFAAGAALFYHNAPKGWASVIGVISFIGGAQLISIGILGEYIGRIYKQTQGRPLFIVTEQYEIDTNPSSQDPLSGNS